jgi:hypothetical protein
MAYQYIYLGRQYTRGIIQVLGIFILYNVYKILTRIWGQEDIALDPRLCLDGIADYLA